ncbi:MAG: PIN domain-containing protein [Candidatus Eremiobacterota bacterium]
MKDNIFIDTNIFIYAFLSDDKVKHEKAIKLLTSKKDSDISISVQVINEIYSSLLKNKINTDLIERYIFEINQQINISPISFETIKECILLKRKYKYSYWDSLILASALENKCSVLYTEDMQSNQIIEKFLIITNPFS